MRNVWLEERLAKMTGYEMAEEVARLKKSICPNCKYILNNLDIYERELKKREGG